MLVAAIALTGSAAFGESQIKVDESLASYQPVEGVSGNLNSIGSDTLNNLMTYWSEEFKKFYPNVNVQIEGKGSSTAPPALIAGLAQLGPMSRKMKASEVDDFERAHGYKPLAVPVAVDALAVFVHKDNPIQGLSLPQVDAIFSKTRRLRAAADIASWGQVGLTGDWTDRPISLYGRNSASGTYGFFKEHALGKGDIKDTVKEQPGSASVVQGITVDRFGIGYSGIGYTTPGVRALPLSKEDGGTFVEANQENAYAGTYPLARFLYVYVNQAPGEGLDPLTKEFLKMVLSKEGQEICIKDGYFPLPAKVVAESLSKIE
ncbi:MAG: phosphate ABC transporter substrate-binding protein [Kiritimatiellae bacterium]|nr:phosphate ABC transporter substrate-binding protein [Kiritimatiellia bacterium]MCO5061694.1 phosphate ABC transporter substrate-binding protein [Kiritimatiellia bacterium]